MASQPDSIFSALNDADLTFPDAVDSQGQTHPVTIGGYVPLLMSGDRTLRASAFDSLFSTYGKFRTTCAAILQAQTKQLKFFADARRYPSSLACALDENEVPVEVYTNLIDSVHRNMGAMHKYTALRRSLLGVEELRPYDLYAPLVGDVDMRFTYDEACEIILEALKPMGEEYLQIVREGLASRWVDVYETPGKRSGAYSAGGFGMHPVILLNFQGTLDDVFTLVHEMGHSVHTYLSCAKQPSCYSDYVIFVAEVASTCNEALLMQYFLDRAKDNRERAYLDQPLPGAVPHHAVPPVHVRGVRAQGQRDHRARRGRDGRCPVCHLPSSERGVLRAGADRVRAGQGGRRHRPGVGPHPALLL